MFKELFVVFADMGHRTKQFSCDFLKQVSCDFLQLRFVFSLFSCDIWNSSVVTFYSLNVIFESPVIFF